MTVEEKLKTAIDYLTWTVEELRHREGFHYFTNDPERWEVCDSGGYLAEIETFIDEVKGNA